MSLAGGGPSGVGVGGRRGGFVSSSRCINSRCSGEGDRVLRGRFGELGGGDGFAAVVEIGCFVGVDRP